MYAQASYHPKGYGVSEGLARARRPFRTGNILIFGTLGAFVFSVYTYSIRAVKQDDFSDVALPSESERAGAVSIEDEHKRKLDLKREVVDALNLAKPAAEAPPQKTPTGLGSLFSMVQGRFGGKAAPSSVVEGAPSVDRIGVVGGGAGEVPAKKVV
ncbi:hypothetical protein RQP46_002737 [Phenoliferia psychrophenolica]